MVQDTAKDKCTAASKRLQISRVKNICRVFELSRVAFRLVPPYGGLLVIIGMQCMMSLNAKPKSC